MSSAPSETTCGSPCCARRLEPVRPGREHAADQLVRELGRGHVEDAGEEAAAYERLHRLPAGAGRVEDEHLVAELLEPLARGRHARRRDAEHRRGDERLRGRRPAEPPPWPAPAISPAAFVMICAEIRLMPAMSTTEYIIVDVDGADVRPRVAGGDRRDDQLRHADRQRAHRLARRSTSRPSRRGRGSRRAAPPRAADAPPPRRRAPSPSIAAPRSPRGHEPGDVDAARLRDLVARDVGRRQRLPRIPASTQQRRRRRARAAGRAGTRTRRPSCRACRARTTVAIRPRSRRAARRRGSGAALRVGRRARRPSSR